jgi:hypothetical protein
MTDASGIRIPLDRIEPASRRAVAGFKEFDDNSRIAAVALDSRHDPALPVKQIRRLARRPSKEIPCIST